MSEKTNGEKLSVIVDFALRANPHVKFGLADVNEAWARLPPEELRQIEGELTASGLFIVFDKKGRGRFMLKDSVRVGLIAAGSYDEYLLARKNSGEMSEEELELAGLRDEEDNIRKADEDARSRRKNPTGSSWRPVSPSWSRRSSLQRYCWAGSGKTSDYPISSAALHIGNPFCQQLQNFIYLSMENVTIPLTRDDRSVLQKLFGNALFILLRTYGVFFLGLFYAYYKFYPRFAGKTKRVGSGDMTSSDYLLAFIFFAVFFGMIFFYFLVRDYRRIALPLQKDLKSGTKCSISFFAQKYADPIYGKTVLFYPGKENFYITLSAGEFAGIANGQEMLLEYAPLSGEIVCLKSEGKIFPNATEFSFSDMPAPKLSRYSDE